MEPNDFNDNACQLLGIIPKLFYWGGSGDGLRAYPDLSSEENKENLAKLISFATDLKWNY